MLGCRCFGGHRAVIACVRPTRMPHDPEPSACGGNACKDSNAGLTGSRRIKSASPGRSLMCSSSTALRFSTLCCIFAGSCSLSLAGGSAVGLWWPIVNCSGALDPVGSHVLFGWLKSVSNVMANRVLLLTSHTLLHDRLGFWNNSSCHYQHSALMNWPHHSWRPLAPSAENPTL